MTYTPVDYTTAVTRLKVCANVHTYIEIHTYYACGPLGLVENSLKYDVVQIVITYVRTYVHMHMYRN